MSNINSLKTETLNPAKGLQHNPLSPSFSRWFDTTIKNPLPRENPVNLYPFLLFPFLQRYSFSANFTPDTTMGVRKAA
jgi:hypothetical protein